MARPLADELHDLAVMNHARAKAVVKDARLSLQLAAQVKEATAALKQDSPEEGHTDDRNQD